MSLLVHEGKMVAILVAIFHCGFVIGSLGEPLLTMNISGRRWSYGGPWIFIFKKINKAKTAQDSKESVKDAQNDIRVLQNTGIRASYSDTQYKSWANSLQQAFEGCDNSANITWGADSPLGTVSVWSTSGYKVAEIFNQLKNDIDYLRKFENISK